SILVFLFQAEDGIRDRNVTGVQTCALPIWGIGPVGDGLQPLGPVLGRDIVLLPWIVAPFGGLSVHDLRTGGTARLGQPGVHEHEIGRASCRERVWTWGGEAT